MTSQRERSDGGCEVQCCTRCRWNVHTTGEIMRFGGIMRFEESYPLLISSLA